VDFKDQVDWPARKHPRYGADAILSRFTSENLPNAVRISAGSVLRGFGENSKIPLPSLCFDDLKVSVAERQPHAPHRLE
jgi:hypothetical protein